MLLSAWVFYMSVKIFFNPFGREFSKVNADDIKLGIIEWYKSPALLPIVLCVFIFICALLLMKVAKKDGAKLDFFTKDKVMGFIRSRELRVSSTIIALIAVYIFALIPICRSNLNFFPRFQGFPFMIATFIFLLAFMIIFNEKTTKTIVVSLIVATIAAIAITFGFGNLALIPLP